MIILTGLKTLFHEGLPNMPIEYITRIVFDANSRALCILRRGNRVVGGICYRPFPQRRFAEIVFLAASWTYQEKVCS